MCLLGPHEQKRKELQCGWNLWDDKGGTVKTTLRTLPPALSRPLSWDEAKAHEDADGPPRSTWGYAQGLTRVSQSLPFAEIHVEIDRAAGRILQLAR